METSKIPTAEEFLKQTVLQVDFRVEPSGEWLSELLDKYANLKAKLYVTAALEAAAEKAETERGYLNNLPVIYVTKKSILNAYPLDNIK